MCGIKNCSLENFGESDKCILHCEKGSYLNDFDNGLLSSFFQTFIDYVIANLFKYKSILGENELKSVDLKKYLESRKYDNSDYNGVLKKTILVPSHIHFPTRDSRDLFDYKKILNLFGQVHFNFCEFYLSSLELVETECFFQDCKFHKPWTLYNYGLLENEDNVIYQTCTFNEKISNYTPDDNKSLAIYNFSLFDYTCNIESIEFERAHFESSLFNTNQHNYLDNQLIDSFKIINCTFNEKFKLNNYKIHTFKCVDSLFENKYEFKENIIDKFYIYNSNFNDIVDFYGSKIRLFNIEKSIFEGFTGFENCIFGSCDKLKEEITLFKYVTFKDSLNARDSRFLSGLDIKNINIQGDTNFLDSDIEIENTNRETFRALKHSFDSIGNIIEANKYYQKEMQRREKELEKDIKKVKNIFEYLVFLFHGLSSNHSQNWVLALFWIIFVSFKYTFIVQLDIKNAFLSISLIVFFMIVSFVVGIVLKKHIDNKPIHTGLMCFFLITLYLAYGLATADFNLNCFSNNINPFSIMTEFSELTFLTLVYKVTIAYLIYQLIVSIRQNTRRK
ncbi:hypothetical protein [Halarcobacter bivalviorum]|uniref:hypothetical protein n=1 Tax=Halarcobacter bivalviorum TaxID=663364 RepID=UPI00100B844C|nr:hypothetical protein [Halarcobacter bivalviorum]RXK03367.1 hypothetical protein CRU97_12665 [Halarcobacter bivalviorum]